MTASHGPADLIALGFDGESVPATVRTAMDAVLASGVVRLLDVVVVTKDDQGDVSTLEADLVEAQFDASGLELDGQGLVGDEDIAQIADAIEPGQTVLVVLFEHVWARDLTAAVAQAGGELLASERIPAWVIDEIESAAADD